MSSHINPYDLPNYDAFSEAISGLALPMSNAHLHGMMCGYLSAGAMVEGEAYLRTLIINKTDENTHEAVCELFHVYTITQQQLSDLGFDFQLFLPDITQSLSHRAQAFSEWCSGFTHGITQADIDDQQLQAETQEAMHHLNEFAELDYKSLRVEAEDEHALMEVTEYTRMAVLHIHSDVHAHIKETKKNKITH